MLTPKLTIIDAIDHAKIFRPWFKDAASWCAWRSLLKAIYALPMSPDELATYQTCTGRTTAPTAQAKEVWACIGRRGGKSLSLAAIAVFTGCFSDWRRFAVPGESLKIPILAADRTQASVILNYVRAMLSEIGMLKKMLVRELADSFELSNGLTISVTTSSFRTARGFSSPLILCDEIAFWMDSDTSSNPSTEVLRALKPSGSTIPNSMLIAASSPYSKRGSLWDAFRRHYGVDDDPVIFWKAPSKTMNPSLPQSIVDDAMRDDPEGAAAEYGAEFRSDIASFIDRQIVDSCVESGCRERAYKAGTKYFAFADPSGGSSDSFTLAIAHSEGDRVIIDCLREWPAPFSPPVIVSELSQVLRQYQLRRCTGDRYAAAWVVEAFRAVHVTYEHSELTRSECYLELLPLLNSRRISLLDNSRAINQIVNLERRTARSGRDSIDDSPGAKDDLGNALAGAAALIGMRARTGSASIPMDRAFWAECRANAEKQQAEANWDLLIRTGEMPTPPHDW
jgi:hypothetical protein